MAGGSTKAVLAALGANFGIACAKFFGAFYTGSAAMMSEGIHSLVDTTNQALLLYGMKRAARPADVRHPFGYASEIYFWSFMVAILLFSLGGGVAIYEGIDKVRSPHPVQNPLVNFTILGVAIVLEAGSFYVAFREFKTAARGTGWWNTITEAKDPVLYTVLFEDAAALLGLVIAAAGLALALLLDMPVLDGAASIVIGAVLVLSAIFLARETKGLLIGEAASDATSDTIRTIARATPGVTGIGEVLTLHLGPTTVLATLALDFEDKLTAADVECSIAELQLRIKTALPDVKRLYIEAQSLTTHAQQDGS